MLKCSSSVVVLVPQCFVLLACREHHKKRDKIKALRRKAADKNPDEFYFNMVSTEKVVCEFCVLVSFVVVLSVALLSLLLNSC